MWYDRKSYKRKRKAQRKADKKAEEPVDLRVNGKLVARGEVVLVDDVYGLRITQIVDAAGRIESLR